MTPREVLRDEAKATGKPFSSQELVLHGKPNWPAALFFFSIATLHACIAIHCFRTDEPTAFSWEGLISGMLGLCFLLVSVLCALVRHQMCIRPQQRQIHLHGGIGRLAIDRDLSFSAVRAVRVTLWHSRRGPRSRVEILCNGEELPCPPTKIPRQQALYLALVMNAPLIKISDDRVNRAGEWPVVVTLSDIQAARQRITATDRPGAIYHSPCPYSLSLSRLCGCEIYCKLDHLQMTGSFKERGARNKLLQLPEGMRKAGVIAASAGNHALGLAYHGQLLSIPVTVVMPQWAPLIKVSNCRSFGATVILHGDTYDEARKLAQATAAEKNLTFIPGFDDPDIIAGQGTMGLEILEDVPDVDAVIIPVGGGGLLAGVGTAIKSLRPQCLVIGVEPRNAPTLDASLRAGKVTRIETKPTLADGLAVAEIGTLCFQMIRGMIDQLRLVDEAQIAKSILNLLELEKTVVEGAGAVPLAAAADRSLGLEGKKIVLLLCGGNIDVTLISRIIERGLAADGRLCRITAAITDRPGGLAQLTKTIAASGASIKEVHHDRNFGPPDISRVYVSCVLETRDFDHIKAVEAALRADGFEIEMDRLD